MSKSNQEELIVCFIPFNFPRYITQFFIDPNTYEVFKQNESIFINYSPNDTNKAIKSIKSSVNKDKNKAFLCFYLHEISGFCSIYSIEKNEFSKVIDYNIKCRGEYIAINLYYMRETRQFIFMCIQDDDNLTMLFFDENYNLSNSPSFKDHGSLKGFSIIYSYYLQNYYIISDGDTNKNSSVKIPYFDNITAIEPKIVDISSYNEKRNKTEDNNIIYTTSLSSIPILISTIQKTLLTTLIDSTTFSTEPKITSIFSKNNTIISTLPETPTTFLIDSTTFSSKIKLTYINSTKNKIISTLPQTSANFIIRNSTTPSTEPKLSSIISKDNYLFSTMPKIRSTSPKTDIGTILPKFTMISTTSISELSKKI